MNKGFLKIALLSAVCVSTPLSFTSCKDYDDDIVEINTTTDGLTKQLADLQTALEAAKSAASAAQDAAQRALEEGQQAAAAAELAKQAAATAKAEAIEAVMNELQPLINSATAANEENAKKIAELAGKIEGIEQGLSNIDLTDINKQIGDQADAIAAINTQLTAINTQITALEKFKTDLTAQLSGYEDLKNKVAQIDGIVSDLNDLKGEVNTLKTKIETLEGTVGSHTTEINTIKGQLAGVSTEISQSVSNAVNTIAGTLSRRLTSVTLMPSLYVDGIPTIEFLSAKYVKKELKNGVWVPSTANKNTFIITNNTTEAEYRLNPGTLKDEDIDINKMAYVSRIATSRAGELVNDIVTVASASVADNGVLNVKLGKGNTESLNLSSEKIYTVSLKVPVAAKHLFAENGETEAAVYSEFTRLAETYFQPELAFIAGAYIGNKSHLCDSAEVYQSEAGKMISKNYVYNKSHNLYELVEGCALFANDTHKALTRAELQAYGMDIKFHVAKAAYEPTSTDKTNQQEYVKLSGENNSVLTPITSSGQEGNQTIVGRQPIIAATLVDVTNNNVIEQKYFKVFFTPVEMEDVKIDWTDISTIGKPCEGASYNFGWKDMAERILEKLNEGTGMSKEEFTKIYGATTPTVAPANDENGKLIPNLVASNLDASTPVMTWTVTKEQLGNLKVGENTATFTKTVTFTDATGLHPNVIVNLKWTVKTTVSPVALGKTDDLKWNNNTMKVYPEPMQLPYDHKQKARYNTNILEGRLKPYTTGMLACGHYDIDFAAAGNPVYPGKLSFPQGYSHWSFTAANQENLDAVYYTIANTNEDGKKLVSTGGIVKVDWSNDINGLSNNRYVFGTINLQIVRILTLNTVTSQSITDNSHSQTINIAKAYSLTDAFGNLVAAEPTAEEPYAADYYEYYGVQTATFGSDIKVADDAEGKVNVRTLASLNMTADVNNVSGELKFQNNGAPLQANAYLIVPVKVTHLWGVLEGHIAVPLNKSNAPLNAPRN